MLEHTFHRLANRVAGQLGSPPAAARFCKTNGHARRRHPPHENCMISGSHSFLGSYSQRNPISTDSSHILPAFVRASSVILDRSGVIPGPRISETKPIFIVSSQLDRLSLAATVSWRLQTRKTKPRLSGKPGSRGLGEDGRSMGYWGLYRLDRIGDIGRICRLAGCGGLARGWISPVSDRRRRPDPYMLGAGRVGDIAPDRVCATAY